MAGVVIGSQSFFLSLVSEGATMFSVSGHYLMGAIHLNVLRPVYLKVQVGKVVLLK